MLAIIGLAMMLYALVCWIHKLESERPKPVHKEKSFTCTMKYGEVECVIHWMEIENPMLPTLEPLVRRWALRQEEISLDLYDSLDAELAKLRCQAITQNIVPKVPPSEEKRPTLTERKLGALLEKRECATELIKVTGAELSRPLQDFEQDFAKTTINELFHHPDHVD
jgi:hypothetical protein